MSVSRNANIQSLENLPSKGYPSCDLDIALVELLQCPEYIIKSIYTAVAFDTYVHKVSAGESPHVCMVVSE